MRRGSLGATFSYLALGTLLGCGGATTGDGSRSQPEDGGTPTADASQPAPVPEIEFVDRAVAAYCGGLRVCCQSQGMAFSATGCDTGVRQGLTESGSFCESGTNYDAQAAGACLQQAESYVASCGSTGPSSAPAVCTRMCVGTVPVGAACQSTEQCAQPSSGPVICDFGVSAPGICTPAVHARLGESCRASCDLTGDCSWRLAPVGVDSGVPGNACYAEDGLYCAGNSTCQRLGELGGACEGWDTCVSGMYCSMVLVCEAKKAAGTSCATPDECLGACDGTTGRCVGDNALAVTAELCAGNFGVSSTTGG